MSSDEIPYQTKIDVEEWWQNHEHEYKSQYLELVDGRQTIIDDVMEDLEIDPDYLSDVTDVIDGLCGFTDR